MFMVFGVITVLISRSFNLGLKIHHPPFNGLGVVSPDHLPADDYWYSFVQDVVFIVKND